MDSRDSKKTFCDETVYELERSVSLCTLCELETKYLTSRTQSYELSLPLLEVSSASDDFSKSTNFTPERPAESDYLATIADLRQYENSPVNTVLSNCTSNENTPAKIYKKSPIINDEDISSSFLKFLQKTTEQVSDKLAERRENISADKRDENQDKIKFRDKTVLPTVLPSEDKSIASEVSEKVIKSFISDIDDFLNENDEKLVIKDVEESRESNEISGKIRTQKTPPRSFDSDIRDYEIPRKRSKIFSRPRKFIDTPRPKKIAEPFVNVDNSMSHRFADDFRKASLNSSRKRETDDLPKNCNRFLFDEKIFRKESKIIVEKVLPIEGVLERGKRSNVVRNCTQSFLDEEILRAKEETKMADELALIQSSMLYDKKIIDSHYREDVEETFSADEKNPCKKLKIDEIPSVQLLLELRKQKDYQKFENRVDHFEGKEHFVKKLKIECGKLFNIPKSEVVSEFLVGNEEICKKSKTYDEEEIREKSKIDDEEAIRKNSKICDEEEIRKKSKINDEEEIRKKSKNYDEEEIRKKSKNYDEEEIREKSKIYDEEEIRKKSKIYDEEEIRKKSKNYDEEEIRKKSKNYDEEEIREKSKIYDEEEIRKKSKIYDEEISRISVQFSSGVDEKTVLPKPEVDAVPLDEAMDKEIPRQKLKIIDDVILAPTMRLPLKTQDGHNPPQSKKIKTKEKNIFHEQILCKIEETISYEEVPIYSMEIPIASELANVPNIEISQIAKSRDGQKFIKNSTSTRNAEEVDKELANQSAERALRKKQNRIEVTNSKDKENLAKSWKDVKKEFVIPKLQRRRSPSYSPLVLRKSPPPPDLKTIRAKAAKRREILAEAINRLHNLSSYTDEVRSIFCNDNKQAQKTNDVKVAKSSNGRMKILVSTSTQTSYYGPNSPNGLPALPSVAVEVPKKTVESADNQDNQSAIKPAATFDYNPFDVQRDSKIDNKSAQNFKSSGSAANLPNTFLQFPVIVEETTNQYNRPEIIHDMQSYSPSREQRDSKKFGNAAENEKSADVEKGVSGPNLPETRNKPEIIHDMHSYNPLRVRRVSNKFKKSAQNKKSATAPRKPFFLDGLM